MKKLFRSLLFVSIFLSPIQAAADGGINIQVALPPPIHFESAPRLVVLPETYIYADPDVDEDIYFWDGWWWRRWEGRWYRSQFYNSDWAFYDNIPVFYERIPSDWRRDFREHRWRGHPWNYQWIPHEQLQRHWDDWKKNRRWEHEHYWGVDGMEHNRPNREERFRQRPEREPERREDKDRREDRERRDNH